MITKNASDILHKAAYQYTLQDWEKHTTPAERQLLNRVENKLAANLSASVLGSLLYGVPGMLGGAITAGLTPSYSDADVDEFINTNNLAAKLALIPGYNTYKTLKVIGHQRRIQQRVHDAVKEMKEKHK